MRQRIGPHMTSSIARKEIERLRFGLCTFKAATDGYHSRLRTMDCVADSESENNEDTA